MMLDLAFMIVFVAALYYGYQKGMIHTFFSIIGYILGLLLAVKMNEKMVVFLSHHWQVSPKLLPIISFFLILIIMIVLFRLISWGLEQLLQSFSMDRLNQVIGAILYGSIASVGFSILLWYAVSSGFVSSKAEKESYTFHYLYPMAPRMMDGIGNFVPAFKGMFDNLSNEFDQHKAGSGT